MTKIQIRKKDHQWFGDTHPRGQVLRDIRDYYETGFEEHDVEGTFYAELSLSHYEETRSSVTWWFNVEQSHFLNPEGAPEIPITRVPMRSAEFYKLLCFKSVSSGFVTGRFRFNKKGTSVSLELVQ